jgi:hypothetical protein
LATRTVCSGTGSIGVGLSDMTGLRGGSATDPRDMGRPAGPARFRQQYRKSFLHTPRGPERPSVSNGRGRLKPATLFAQPRERSRRAMARRQAMDEEDEARREEPPFAFEDVWPDDKPSP